MSIDAPSFEDQYHALREGRAVVELPDWSSVAVTGADRLAFLHNFCTNDIKRLFPGASCEAFFTDVKGKIVGHGLVTAREDELVIVGPPNQSSGLIQHLDRYVIREDVKLHDATHDRNYLLIAGVHVPHSDVEFNWNLIGSEICRLIELPANDASAKLAALREQGIALAGPLAFTAARVEAGVPFFGVDFNEQNLPQEVGRDREAISFSKGCYLGQETVARIDALGHVNQQIVGVRFFESRVPEPGTELFHADKRVGRVSSSTFSPQWNAPLALAMVRREANAPDTRLDSSCGGCQVVVLPLAAS